MIPGNIISAFRLLLLLLCAIVGGATSSSFQGDPYRVLGLPPDASQDEIRSRYRQLCLKYHPDKNVDKSRNEREKCTELFKSVQAAHGLIGDAESRRSFDHQRTASSFFQDATHRRSSGLGTGTAGGGHSPFRDETMEAFYRAFAGHSGPTANFFAASPRNRPNIPKPMSPMYRNPGSFKSKFVQRIRVPLPDLYRGRSNMKFTVRDSPWKSYTAAFRGGFGYLLLYQSVLFAFPLLRLSKWATLAVGALIFHLNVPRPQSLPYRADILPGYKQGTKITFHDAQKGFDLVFVVEEEPHENFVRQGNDLHTTVEILASQAKEGCVVHIRSLNPLEEPPIRIRLSPNQIRQSGDVIAVPHRGWPQRRTGKRGDLIVHFKIIRRRPRSTQRTKRRSRGK